MARAPQVAVPVHDDVVYGTGQQAHEVLRGVTDQDRVGLGLK